MRATLLLILQFLALVGNSDHLSCNIVLCRYCGIQRHESMSIHHYSMLYRFRWRICFRKCRSRRKCHRQRQRHGGELGQCCDVGLSRKRCQYIRLHPCQASGRPRWVHHQRFQQHRFVLYQQRGMSPSGPPASLPFPASFRMLSQLKEKKNTCHHAHI